jgi:hypothetical protein
LRVNGGAFDGQGVAMSGLSGERLLGSGPDAALRVEAPNVEPSHARVRWDQTGVFVDDLSVEKGTFLNGERFEVSGVLNDGDRIWLGPPGEDGSIRIAVHLPGHPGDFAEEGSPDATETAQEWGALDDDEKVIALEPKAPAAPPAAKRRPAETVVSRIAADLDDRSLPPMAPVRRAPARSISPPPLGRALMVAGAAAVLGIAGFAVRARSQAGGPALVLLLPPKAEPGQTIQIGGTGFAPKPEANLVSFGDKQAEVVAATETQLTVVVPPGLPPDDKPQHRVRVNTRGHNSNTLFFQVFLGPRVTGFEPDVAMPGDVVKAAGEHLGSGASITVGGMSAEVVEATDTLLRFRVPSVPVVQGKPVPVGVQVAGNAARLSSLLIGRLPLLLGAAPPQGVPGDRVTLAGRGFDPAPGGTVVTFGDRRALVVSAGERELTVVVPSVGALSGSSELTIAVRVGVAASATPLAFSIRRASVEALLPRFCAEPGGDTESVLVSSDVGPFLRLRGRADAPSAAERGSRVASAINQAMEQASRGGPLAVEMREKPEPAVALVGAAQPIVTASADDAFAYDARPTPRALARHWTALLQDYLALFAQRQRPYHVLEATPRGQVLLDLFATAERRAGVGVGVPPGLVEGLSPAQLSAIAEMAMGVPGEGQAASGAAVAGRWEGSLDESGHASRKIQVRLSAGSRLSGALSVGSGEVSGELPLEEISYRPGSLSFVATLGSTPLRFLGTVDGRTVTGSVQAKDGKPVGSFSLRWLN